MKQRRLRPVCLRVALFSCLILNTSMLATPGIWTRAHAQEPPEWSDPEAERLFDDLIARMTIEEKLGQLTQYSWGAATGPMAAEMAGTSLPELFAQRAREGRVGSFFNVVGAAETRALQEIAVEESRLGIPLLFGYDVIHGLRTEFPVPLAEAATWNPDAVREAARIAAVETAAHGIHWTFAPMVDIARDARWGRIVEGSGEDPYLGMVMADARVRGFQGDDLADPFSVLACVKHFAAYGAAEAGRDYNTVDISERTLRDVYLPPFHAAVEAGVGSVMTSFNEIGGIVSTVSPFLLDQVLRDEWGFEGFVVSDWTSIMEAHIHGIGEVRADVGELALESGVEMDMMSDIYPELVPRVEQGDVPMEVLDRAVRRVLRAKHRLGLFEDPYRYSDTTRQAAYTLADEHIEHARRIARESIVLLKNDGALLPLSKDLGTLAVIGALANSDDAPLGPWAAQGRPGDVVNVLEGISGTVGSGTSVVHVAGVDPVSGDTSGLAAAVTAAVSADAVILVLGEPRNLSGEAASRATIDLPGAQLAMAQAVIGTGRPVVIVLMNGRPLAIPWLAEHAQAILETWYLGVQMGPAVADVLFGDYNPSGRLTATFPRVTGQIPIYYNHKMTGRPPTDQHYTSKYLDVPVTPQFAFGHGLSYTEFAYSDLDLADTSLTAADTIWASVSVRNTGDRRGKETVQIYLRDVAASVTRPVMELKGFAQVELEPGEARRVTFGVPVASMGLYDATMTYVVEPGRMEVMIGHASDDVRARGAVQVTGPVVPVDHVPRFAVSAIQ